MDGITIEDTRTDANTITVEKFHDLLLPVLHKPILTPKEANQLTFHLTELLMINNCEPKVLRILSRYLSKKSYEEIVEERVIEHFCGYPLCKHNDPKKIKDMQVNSLVKSLKMPRYYKSRYCCKNHYLCSEFYKNQLSFEALFMRVNLNQPWFAEDTVENGVVLLDQYINMKEKRIEVDDLDNVIDMLRRMNVEDSGSDTKAQELIEKFEGFKVIEHTGTQKSNDIYGNE